MNDNEIIICSNCYEENRCGENYCHNCGKRLYYNLDSVNEEQAKESYNRIEPVSYSYQSKYPDIFEKYASQYK